MPTPEPATPAALLERALRADSARALVSFYDDGTGERAELSVATFANWVAKTANFTRDGLGLLSGDRVAVALPCHWQALVWWQACWAAGLVVTDLPPAPGTLLGALVRATVWPPDAPLSADAAPAADEVVALGLGPMALPLRGAAVPPGAVDHDREIHAHGDRFDPGETDPDTPAAETATRVRTAGDLGRRAAATAERWALTAADRVLVTDAVGTAEDAVRALLAPLAAGAGVVLVRHAALATEEALARRLADEGVTAVLPLATSGAAGTTAQTPAGQVARFLESGLRRLD